jgi:hypothetical protein
MVLRVRNRTIHLGISGLLLLATVGRCWAFDIDGYKTGMPLAEVQRLLRPAGVDVRMVFLSSSGEDEDGRVTYAARRFINGAYAESLGTFTFCYGTLANYQKILAGSFREFVNIVKRETALRGAARYTADNYVIPDTGTRAWVNFGWRIPADDPFSVEYTTLSSSNAPSGDRLTMFYGEMGRCPNR